MKKENLYVWRIRVELDDLQWFIDEYKKDKIFKENIEKSIRLIIMHLNDLKQNIDDAEKN